MTLSNLFENKKLLIFSSGFIFIFIGLILVVYIFFFSSSHNKWSIQIEGSKTISKKEIKTLISYLIRTEKKGISTEQLEEALLLNPRIKTAYVYIRPNKIMKIIITEKQTSHINQTNGKFSEISEDFFVIEEDIQQLNKTIQSEIPMFYTLKTTSKKRNKKVKKQITNLFLTTKNKYAFIWQRISEIKITRNNIIIYPSTSRTKILIHDKFDKYILKRIWGVFII